MCLAIPGKVVKIENNEVTVDYGTECRKAVNAVIGLKPGQLVLVEMGMVTRVVTEEESSQRLKLFNQQPLPEG